MKTPARYFSAGLIVIIIFCAGYFTNRKKYDFAASSVLAATAATYACPMHPQYRSDHVMDCPICGMRLEPLTDGPDGSRSSGSNLPPGTVQISADKQQLIGIRVAPVQQTSSSYKLRVPGRITIDDQRLHKIIAASDGWILNLEPYTAGHFVKKNELLGSYYTKDLLGTERLFLVSLSGNETSQNNMGVNSPSLRVGASIIPQYPVDSLRGLGMNDLQIQEIQQTRTAAPNIKIYSPVTGYVLSRDISPEQRFDKGAEFYRIADISHVWVAADIFEKDRELINSRTTATIRYQGLELQAKLSDALPQFDPESRILKTRFELNNPGSMLLPGMFVDVDLQMEAPESITVPDDAIIDTGNRKTVYVERGNGVFEPRLVETGLRYSNQVQITKGLAAGERIAMSGNFLIDSESRMRFPEGTKPRASETSQTVKDYVCGMDVDPKSPHTLRHQYKGKNYYFCGEMCRKKFEANPEKYIPAQAAPKADKAKDLVCGMDVDPKSPHTLQHQYKGKTYYFCGEMCKKKFAADPEKYISEPAVKKADKAKDLVCGMDVDPGAAGTFKTQYEGKTYYFCSKQCKIHFEANPEQYIHAGTVPADKHMHGMSE